MVVVQDENGKDKLGFEYLEGPVTPKPERIPPVARAKPRRRSSFRRKPPKDDGNGPPRGGSVPKVPLVRA